jgi:hypothetical protein
MNKLAPIIFICYNRYEHAVKSLESLKKNRLAKKSKIFIFSDAALKKDKKNQKKILKIRKFIKKVRGFKSKTLILRKNNFGNKKNILTAVDRVFKNFDKAIVVEDDLLVSPYFLDYMNLCLNYYSKYKTIWHINGWSYPFLKNSTSDINFSRTMNCWGWGTWRNRWKSISTNEAKYIKNFNNKMRHNFDIQSSANFWSQIIRNKNKTLKTWAVFWYATIFVNKGLTIYPKQSFVKNIGMDGSGRAYKKKIDRIIFRKKFDNFKFNDKISINNIFLKNEFKYYMREKTSLKSRLATYFKKIYYKLFNSIK